MTQKLKLFATASALRFLRFLRWTSRGIRPIFRGLGRFLAPLGRLTLRFFVLPLYRFGVSTRIRANRLALPARGVVFFLITNRYLLHVTLGALLLVTLGANLQGKQALAQDVGQHSILFALASDSQTEIVEETVQPATSSTRAQYLGSATVSGVPHVDFDYDENADTITPSIVIPGTVAAAPYEAQTPTAARAPRTKIETYVVQENDTIGSIANRFGVNVGTILWNNNLTETQYIRPGDSLVIPPVSGLIAKVKSGDTLAKLAKRFSADADEIAASNNLSPDATLALGMDLVIPGGKPPEIVRTQTQVAVQPELPPAIVTAPIYPTPKPPNADTHALPSERLLWPTSGHVITQYYGWRHTGVDIDGDYTSPIYAAADGVVEKAGWNSGGYGLMILIDHPNGVKTRYGHSSKMFVKTGDTVTRGQVIAMVGTTGRSTGTHLHFEVYVNNVRTNPLGYIR